MKTKSIELVVEENHKPGYPNCYAPIPPNGAVCSYTGLRHTHLYNMLSARGGARPYVRVVNLREPGASKGKTLFHVGDFFRYLDWCAKQQGSGQERAAIEGEGEPQET